ncbi:MAG TPA: hypothetical protein P5114_06275 [Hyphomicrobiaceae bacterium]|nr:hypothetical protein [Hyphomicrobiaceae bacterium]
MATYPIANGAFQSASHQPAASLPAVAIGIKALFRMIRAAYRQANAAHHVYEGQLACAVPRDLAARRSYQIFYTKPATH